MPKDSKVRLCETHRRVGACCVARIAGSKGRTDIKGGIAFDVEVDVVPAVSELDILGVGLAGGFKDLCGDNQSNSRDRGL